MPSTSRSETTSPSKPSSSSDRTATVKKDGKPTAAERALSLENVIYDIVRHLEDDLILQGREHRQALLSQLGLVSKAWLKPVCERLYRNPFFGTADRAHQLYQSLDIPPAPIHLPYKHPLPARRLLIKKLIFGEGSNTDIQDWPTLELVPNLIKAAGNLEVVGLDGLHNVNLDLFRDALHSCKKLEEIRGCGRMPEPFCFVGYFFDEVLGACQNVKRFRLYNINSDPKQRLHIPHSLFSPRPSGRPLEKVAFNNCSIKLGEMRNILNASSTTLRSLYLEYPTALSDDDLVQLLTYSGANLKSLTVHDFAAGLSQSQLEGRSNIVEQILRICPALEILNFADAIGSPKLFNGLMDSKLKLWSFSCTADVRPQHWLDVFEQPGFPSPASCRVYVKGWTSQDIRHVRLKAHEHNINWLSSGRTFTDMCEEAML